MEFVVPEPRIKQGRPAKHRKKAANPLPGQNEISREIRMLSESVSRKMGQLEKKKERLSESFKRLLKRSSASRHLMLDLKRKEAHYRKALHLLNSEKRKIAGEKGALKALAEEIRHDMEQLKQQLSKLGRRK